MCGLFAVLNLPIYGHPYYQQLFYDCHSLSGSVNVWYGAVDGCKFLKEILLSVSMTLFINALCY